MAEDEVVTNPRKTTVIGIIRSALQSPVVIALQLRMKKELENIYSSEVRPYRPRPTSLGMPRRAKKGRKRNPY